MGLYHPCEKLGLWPKGCAHISIEYRGMCSLLIPHCQVCQLCHPCRGALLGIAHQQISAKTRRYERSPKGRQRHRTRIARVRHHFDAYRLLRADGIGCLPSMSREASPLCVQSEPVALGTRPDGLPI